PSGIAGIGFAGLSTVSAATNASPIVLTVSSMSCVPDAGDRYMVSGVGGNLAANGTYAVMSASSTHLTLVGTVGSGAYTSGGVVIPVGGKCDVAGNWALGGSSNYKAGVSHVVPDDPYTCSMGPCDSPGTGPALDSTDVGVNVTALIAA